MMWAFLIHLGYHMWADRGKGFYDRSNPISRRAMNYDELICEKKAWEALTNDIAARGLNTLLIDLGEGIKYESHPELAINGSWTVDELKAELKRLRSIGLTPIPKLNFSAAHDDWLGEYQRMVSTKKYYEVCKDLIDEVCDIFDNPEYFHIGMDEEAYHYQTSYSLGVVRHGDLWWHDLHYLVDLVEKNNSTAWVWSDKIVLSDKEEYVKKMPKSVLQSMWYYGRDFSYPGTPTHPLWDAYKYFSYLDEHGYKQVPTGSNWEAYENMELLAKFCKTQISPENLIGYMMAPWQLTIENEHLRNVDGAELLRQVKDYEYGNK